MDEEVGSIALHGGVGAHAAARHVDAPALPIVSPDHRNETDAGRSAACGSARPAARRIRPRKILEADAIEQVLALRQVFEQRLGGEIGVRQRVDKDRVADIAEALGGRNLDQHPRRPIGARPDDARLGGHVARLNAVGNLRPVRRKAQRRPRDAAERGDRRRCGRGFQQRATCERRAPSYFNGHRASAIESGRRLTANSDEDSNIVRLHDDDLPSAEPAGCAAIMNIGVEPLGTERRRGR